MKTAMKGHHELSEHVLCETGFLEYPRFFPRQIVTDSDLTLEHQYWRDKLRRHNLFLHGWGVVCGAKVCLVPTCDGSDVEPWKVAIEPGYILGPYGDEIVIDRSHNVDLRKRGYVATTGEPCGEVKDPWCSEVYVKCPPGRLFVAVRYKEVLCRPVRIQPIGCGCDDMPCEYSRIRDGYEVAFLCDCPDSHKPKNGHHTEGKDRNKEEQCTRLGIPDCPCPTDPWVVLAAVDLDEDGTITGIDNCLCRRLVKSFADEVWRCEMRCPTVEKIEPADGMVELGAKDVTVTLRGERFQDPVHIRGGGGITFGPAKVSQNNTELTFKLTVSKDVRPGPRRITVQYPDCCFTTFEIMICEIKETPSGGETRRPPTGIKK